MSRFATCLEVSLIDENSNTGRGTWRVLVPLVYVSDLTNSTYTVPANFETDFATIPRLPLVFALFGDCAHRAAVLHDWLYTTKKCHNPLPTCCYWRLWRAQVFQRGGGTRYTMLFDYSASSSTERKKGPFGPFFRYAPACIE